MLKKFVFIVLVLVSTQTFATHIRAGEITYTHITGTTYEITLTIFTKTSSPNPSSTLFCISYGDTSLVDTISLTNSIVLGNDITKNSYVQQHTFPGSIPNPYIIIAECFSRTADIVNISNSINTIFYIETELYINPFQGINNSPIFLNPPIDSACVNNLYSYYSGANDVDGDSLYYSLQQSLKEGGVFIPGYQFPPASNFITIDNYTGIITWDTPILSGLYNFDVLVEEYRNGFKIGSVLREMQVDVKPTCVVGVNEPSNNNLTLTVYPNPFNNELTVNYEPKNNTAKLEVYNLIGEKIKSQNITENISFIDLSRQSNGIYFIVIIDGENRISRKVIKQ